MRNNQFDENNVFKLNMSAFLVDDSFMKPFIVVIGRTAISVVVLLRPLAVMA